jgi:transglutaminase-like putative cysteine protease
MARRNALRSPLGTAADLGAVSALLSVGIVGFGPLFGGTGYLVAGFGGLVLGVGIGWLGARFRIGILPLSALTIFAFLVFGAALTLPATTIFMVLPSTASLQGLLLGAVQTWKQVLTALPPVGSIQGTLILPFLATLVCSVLAVSFALRLKRFGWALIPAGALAIIAIAFGTGDAAFPVAQGVIFAAIALSWFATRRALQRGHSAGANLEAADNVRAHRRLQTRRVAAGAGVLAGAVLVAVLVQSAILPSNARQILRTAVIPPVDIHNYPSPLQSYRKYVKEGVNPKDILFTVAGLPEGARLRLATLDSYDGIVYSVADDGGSGAGSFTTVTAGATAPADQFLTGTTNGRTAAITITDGSMSGVWLPDIGYATSITFAGRRARALASGLNYNATTGVAISTATLQRGDTYTVKAILPRRASAAGTDPLANVALPANQSVPDAVNTFASKATASAQTPAAQMNALASALKSKGFFSHGLSGDFASLPGHGEQRLTNFLTAPQIVGDDEQYAVALALMANQMKIPARVVMGFYPKTYSPGGSVTITGADLHAWVEVDFNNIGWVPFDSTPNENKKPDQNLVKTQLDPRAQVLQPPPAPPVAVAAPNDPAAKGGKTSKLGSSGLDAFIGALTVAGTGLGILAVLLGPALLIAWLKVRRRRRRALSARTADRLSGGWDEIVDIATDLGTRVTAGGTRMDGARALAENYPSGGVLTLAARADTGIFGPSEPTAADTDAFWGEVDRLVKDMRGSVGRLRRLRARLSLATFRSRSSIRLTEQVPGMRNMRPQP